MTDRTLGNDVSFYQLRRESPGPINFAQMVKQGSRFVFIKASQATYSDPRFLQSWDAAKSARILRGAYHYIDHTKGYRAQAEYFAKLILSVGVGELPPVADYEEKRLAPHASIVRGGLKQFLEIVETMTGVVPIIYTSPGYWQQYGSGEASWKKYDLWIAHYGVRNPDPVTPWGRDWRFWQYSHKGPGLKFGVESMEIDMNWFSGSEEELYKYAIDDIVAPEQPEPSDVITATVLNAPGLNVRKEPRVGSKVTDWLLTGAKIEVAEVKKVGNDYWGMHATGWSCLYLHSSGRYFTDYRDFQDTPEPSFTPAKVTNQEGLNVRISPSLRAAVTGWLRVGSNIKISEISKVGHDYWGRHESGWSCLYLASSKRYFTDIRPR